MERVLLLSNNDNARPLYEWLVQKGYNVKLCADPVTVDMIDSFAPELAISYNYRHIIRGDVIERMGGRMINMHTSYLPWNKGTSPNIWSFIDDTPKGVTIQRLERGLDTGGIILQKELEFDEDTETLASTYEKLNAEIVRLLTDNWEMIESGDYVPTPQKGQGSYHRTSDLEALLKGRTLDYHMTIAEFKRFIADLRYAGV